MDFRFGWLVVADDIDLCSGKPQSGCYRVPTAVLPPDRLSVFSALYLTAQQRLTQQMCKHLVSISCVGIHRCRKEIAITICVYLGTNSANLDLVQVLNSTRIPSLQPNLELGTTYHFRVDAKSTTFSWLQVKLRSFESFIHWNLHGHQRWYDMEQLKLDPSLDDG